MCFFSFLVVIIIITIIIIIIIFINTNIIRSTILILLSLIHKMFGQIVQLFFDCLCLAKKSRNWAHKVTLLNNMLPNIQGIRVVAAFCFGHVSLWQ